jgi:hypothetical protein
VIRISRGRPAGVGGPKESGAAAAAIAAATAAVGREGAVDDAEHTRHVLPGTAPVLFKPRFCPSLTLDPLPLPGALTGLLTPSRPRRYAIYAQLHLRLTPAAAITAPAAPAIAVGRVPAQASPLVAQLHAERSNDTAALAAKPAAERVPRTVGLA